MRVLQALPSPGVGLKHYSPRARLILLEWAHGQVIAARRTAASRGRSGRHHVAQRYKHGHPYLVYRWGDLADQEELARRLFAGLRELDAAGATVIVCPLPEDEGLGVAMRDRLLKAAR